ncbi:MAG: hypothetical protein JXR62_03055, partial [Bacilli bacterium]|nr:hypothetical protein [Bacilli bacterium]
IRDYVCVKFNENGTITYRLKDEEDEIIVIFKNSTITENFVFDSKYTLIFDGQKRSRRIINKIEVDDITTYILKRK